jgi:hypothetical protein
MNWKGSGKKRSSSKLRYLGGETEKNYENFSQDVLSLYRHFKLVPTEYERGALTAHQQLSIERMWKEEVVSQFSVLLWDFPNGLWKKKSQRWDPVSARRFGPHINRIWCRSCAALQSSYLIKWDLHLHTRLLRNSVLTNVGIMMYKAIFHPSIEVFGDFKFVIWKPLQELE